MYKHPMSLWSPAASPKPTGWDISSQYSFCPWVVDGILIWLETRVNESRYHICLMIRSHIVNNSTQLLFLIKWALWELVSIVGFEPTASCLIDRLSNHYTRLERTKLDSHRDYSCYRRIYKHPMSMWSRGHHVPLPPLSLGSWWYFNMVRDKGNEDRYHICFIIHSHIVNNSTQLLFFN